jgi:uncharacterized protein DUF3313
MKKAIQFIAVAAIGAVVAVSASPAEGEFSGFLGDYSKLAKETDATGDTVLRYISPSLKPGTYQKVLLDPVQYYPAPQPSPQVDERTLSDIRNYMDKALREKLGSKLALASEPGPGVARMRPAITSVVSKTPGLKPYELIPIGFLISTAKGRGKEAAIQLEVELVDSVTGERLGAAARSGVGAKLEGKDAKLKVDDLRPLLDKWIDTGATFVAERLK